MPFVIQYSGFTRLLWNCLGEFRRLQEQCQRWHMSDLGNHRVHLCPATSVEKALPCFPLSLRSRVPVTGTSRCDRNFPIIEQDKTLSRLAPRSGVGSSLPLSETSTQQPCSASTPHQRAHLPVPALPTPLGWGSFPWAVPSSSQLEVAFGYITDTSWWVVIWFSRGASWERVSGTGYGGGWGRMWSHAWSEKQ